MTSSIKPPGAGSPAPRPVDPPLAGVEGSRASSFEDALDGVDSSPSPGAAVEGGPSSAPAAADPIAAALVAGAIDADAAVSALVDRALDSPMAAALTDRGRERLAEHLHDSLANDPTLAAMVRDLERGS